MKNNIKKRGFWIVLFVLVFVIASVSVFGADWKFKYYIEDCSSIDLSSFEMLDIKIPNKPLLDYGEIGIDPNSNILLWKSLDDFPKVMEGGDQCVYFHTFAKIKPGVKTDAIINMFWDDGIEVAIGRYNCFAKLSAGVGCYMYNLTYLTNLFGIDEFFAKTLRISTPSSTNKYFSDLFDLPQNYNQDEVLSIWIAVLAKGSPNNVSFVFPAESKLTDFFTEIDSDFDFDDDSFKGGISFKNKTTGHQNIITNKKIYDLWNENWLNYHPPEGENALDCNDAMSTVNPNQKEICYNAYDDDCDFIFSGESDPIQFSAHTQYDDLDGLHEVPAVTEGAILDPKGSGKYFLSCNQEQNQYTCEGTSGYEFITNKGSFLQGAGCCGNSGGDLGSVVKPTSGPKTGKNVICYNDGTKWYWKDATEHGFEIEKSPSLNYDVISDSLNWFGCKESGTLPGGINTLNAYQILTYSGAAAAEIIGFGETSATYVGGTNDLALVPAEQWNSGLSIFTAAGGGIPGYCNNNILDADKGESDVDCGGSCNHCFDNKNCNVNEDCLSGNCDETEKKCKPTTVPVDLSQKSYMAKRFICSARNAENIFTECTGFNLGTAKNINLRDKIRRAGNLLSGIFEFVAAADNVNYAIVYGLPIEIADPYYLIPFYIERDADNNITNWAQYDNLEFDIAYAKDITPYLQVAIFNGYDEPWNKKFETSLSSSTKVFDQPIKNFIVNQPQEGKWLHVKIPLTFARNRITFIALYAAQKDVSKDIIITHPNLSRQYRNVIAIDRIALTKSNVAENKYCAAFPTGSVDGYVGDYWINGSDLDNTNILDVMSFPIGKIICDQTPSWGWTGTKCCGNDYGENYTDTKAGCLRGSIVRNNSIFNFSENADGSGEITSVLFMNQKFYTCGNGKQTFNNTINAANRSVVENTNCNSLGAWYCDFDSFWKDKYRIAGQIINTTYTLPIEVIPTNAPGSAVKGCCPQNYCWSGPEFIVDIPANETGSRGCVPDQSKTFALGDEYLFNSTLIYGKYDNSFIVGNDAPYRCIKGMWNIAIPKWNPEHTKQGYCERFDQCFLDDEMGCVDSGYWKGEKYCEAKKQDITIGTVTLNDIDFANWTTRTKLVAYELFKIANSSAESRRNFTIYCDSYDKVLNEYKYYQAYFAGKSSEELILGDKITVQTIGGTLERFKCPNQGANETLPCTNSWCVLRYDENGEKIIIGTSLNLQPDTKQYSANAILKLFPESSSTLAGADHYDFCDKAIMESNATGNFYGCLGRESSAAPNENANLWFNNRTQVLLYSVTPFTIRTEAPTFFENFFRNPILTIIQLFAGNPLAPSFEFVKELSDFNKIYISVLDSKKIMGVIERVGANQTMIVNYQNIGINITEEPYNSMLNCGNPFEVNICMYDAITNNATYVTKSFNKFDLFDELTARTRLK